MGRIVGDCDAAVVAEGLVRRADAALVERDVDGGFRGNVRRRNVRRRNVRRRNVRRVGGGVEIRCPVVDTGVVVTVFVDTGVGGSSDDAVVGAAGAGQGETKGEQKNLGRAHATVDAPGEGGTQPNSVGHWLCALLGDASRQASWAALVPPRGDVGTITQMLLPSRLSLVPLVALIGSGCSLLIEPSIPYDASRAQSDASVDVSVDVSDDVLRDASKDVSVDVPFDAPADAPTDVPFDLPADHAVDAPLCIPTVAPSLISPWSGSMVRSPTPVLKFDLHGCNAPVVVEISASRDHFMPIMVVSASASATSVSAPMLASGVPWFWRVRYRDVMDPRRSTSVINEFRVGYRRMPPMTHSGGVYGTLPDGNGDGIPELAIGAPAQDSAADAGMSEGRVYVFTGGREIERTSMRELSPPEGADAISRATFGYRVTGGGDLNGDGFPDLVVGSRGVTVFVFFGSEGGFANPAVMLRLTQSLLQPPVPPVAGVGDIDGDGICDIVAGIPQTMGGNVVVLRGGRTAFSGPMADVLSEPVSYGFAIAPAGDVDGDGFADFVIGSPVNTTLPGASTALPRVQVRLSSGRTLRLNVPAMSLFSDFGRTVSAAGDLDGDGLGEVLASQGGGSPYLWVSRFEATSTNTAPIDLDGGTSSMQLTPVGDVNQDGLDDLVRWTPRDSFALVRSGPMSMVDLRIVRTERSELINVPGVGDVDNDGRDDIATTWKTGTTVPFVVVYSVLPRGPLGADVAVVLATFTAREEPYFGRALGTAY